MLFAGPVIAISALLPETSKSASGLFVPIPTLLSGNKCMFWSAYNSKSSGLSVLA